MAERGPDLEAPVMDGGDEGAFLEGIPEEYPSFAAEGDAIPDGDGVAEEEENPEELEARQIHELEQQLGGGVDEDELGQAQDMLEMGDGSFVEEQFPADAVDHEGEEVLGDQHQNDSDLSDIENLGVDENLKDAVEGSVRLKRLLSREDPSLPQKKRKVVEEEVEDPAKSQLAKYLLTKWNMTSDMVLLHALQTFTLVEMQDLDRSNFAPERFHNVKTPAELCYRHVQEVRERRLPPGNAHDCIAAFRYRWKIDVTSDKVLRTLSHKDLRHVLTNFDGSLNLSDLVNDAKATEWQDDYTTGSAAPNYLGLTALSRFTRLELIDPVADAAVFGDANLTFALKLAKHRSSMHHVGRVIATTFEDLDTLRQRYNEIDASIVELEGLYADVHHCVDCTRIAIDPRLRDMQGSLGGVYYNFPHSGAIQGFFDGHPVVNWRHENLMRLFFRALRSFVKPGGVVKVSSNMGAVGVRFGYIIGSALENEFVHIETVPFLEWHLHRYGRSYGDKRDVYKRPDAKNNQSYNAQAADRDMVYCFTYAPSGEQLPPQQVKLPPTHRTLRSVMDGPFKNLHQPGKEHLARQLHKRFLTELSGVHVG